MEYKKLTEEEINKLKKVYSDAAVKEEIADMTGKDDELKSLEELRDKALSKLIKNALVIALGDMTEIGKTEFSKKLEIKISHETSCLTISSNTLDFAFIKDNGFEKEVEVISITASVIEAVDKDNGENKGNYVIIQILISFKEKREESGIHISLMKTGMEIIV